MKAVRIIYSDKAKTSDLKLFHVAEFIKANRRISDKELKIAFIDDAIANLNKIKKEIIQKNIK